VADVSLGVSRRSLNPRSRYLARFLARFATHSVTAEQSKAIRKYVKAKPIAVPRIELPDTFAPIDAEGMAVQRQTEGLWASEIPARRTELTTDSPRLLS
jgi:hypothetical protein